MLLLCILYDSYVRNSSYLVAHKLIDLSLEVILWKGYLRKDTCLPVAPTTGKYP